MSTDPNPPAPLPGTGAPPHVPNPAPNPIPPPTPVPSVTSKTNQHHYKDDYPEVTHEQVDKFQKSGGMPL